MEMHRPLHSHVVLLSSPGLGHLIPVIELGKRFLFHHNVKITVLAVTSQTSEAETQILKSSITPNVIHVIDIPSPNISSLINGNASIVTRLCVMMREATPSIRSTLSKLTPRPSALIVDIFETESLSIARKFNMRKYIFVASHAWFLSLVIYSPTLDKQIQGPYVDHKEPLKIPGCNPVRPEDVVDPMLDRNNIQYQEYLGIGVGIQNGEAHEVLVNTWEELQSKTLQALRDSDLLGRILKALVYGIEPLVRQHVSETNLESELVIQWLRNQPGEYVIYVSFGSGGTLSYEQMTEVSWGLELSGRRFVWVVHLPTRDAADAAFFTNEYSNVDGHLFNYLPYGFISRTKNKDLLVPNWAPQVVVLRHPSVGGFLCHCGWSSVLESITNGVPMIAWPLYAEQRMNATLLVEELGVAVQPKVLPVMKVVDREEIANMVRQIMVGTENVKSKSLIRERVKDIKHSAMESLTKGNSSHVAMSKVLST